MIKRKIPINLWNLVLPLAKTFDFMNPVLADHCLRVAYLAMRLAEELDWPAWKRREVAIAGALHDIGAFSMAERLETMDFETNDEGTHARAGKILLQAFKPFAQVAETVLHHHLPWRHGEGERSNGKAVLDGSHLLHIADRTAVLIRKDRPVLDQVDGIRSSIGGRRGGWFVPAHADALLQLCDRDYVWLEITSGAMEEALRTSLGMETIDMELPDLREFSRLLCRIIDFKSEFTATHSSGVAAVGKALASRVGFSRQECMLYEIAAYLHDLGKLAIPSEILEKRDRLTKDEWSVMRTHVYYTYQVLDPIGALSIVSSWSALHQERLDGSGYPFRFAADDLPLGARIMAVADVFTGITEDRPYRKGMAREDAMRVLHEMQSRGELDGRLIALLETHYDEVSRARAEAQDQAVREYEEFREELRGSGETG